MKHKTRHGLAAAALVAAFCVPTETAPLWAVALWAGSITLALIVSERLRDRF